MKVASAALGVLCALAMAASAHAHATYNISGYGSGIGGSTNGADGMPADGTASWTNGPVADYTGNLPVMWYAGMHSTTQVRTIQSGVAPNPPSGSLLQQTNSYNTANDPDYPTTASSPSAACRGRTRETAIRAGATAWTTASSISRRSTRSSRAAR